MQVRPINLPINPLVAMLTVSLAFAGATVGTAAADVKLTDAGGRVVTISDTSRILSIGGDITEIVYALGAGDRVVAVDATSTFPPQALEQRPSIGYMRALSTEGVLSVGATLILASERCGPPEVVKALKSTSLPYFEVRDEQSPGGIGDKVRTIAKAIGAEQAGEALVAKIEADFSALAVQRAKVRRPIRALFVLSVQNGRAVVGGRNTAADVMLKLAGAKNVAADVIGFRPLSDEAIVELAPEVLVAMRRGSDNDNHDIAQIFSVKGIQSSPAGANKRLIMMEGQYLLGFGPRAPAAARELMTALYPDLKAAAVTK
ncbi:MAG: ABC transporter substrate-binding protein [Hyphomicrobiaceae bacterium]|nr:MAG: ABC transporter substrate-binding protein [Hyphomicrobiaceae bacterium]